MSYKESNIPIAGGLIAAAGAGLCCAGPLVLLLLGVSGSWIGSLTLLEPFRPYFILVVIVLFSYAARKIYRPIDKCEPGSTCAVPKVRLGRQIILWVAGLIALVLVTSNYWIIFFV